MAPRIKPPRERVEARVDRSGGPDACHPWTGAQFRGGYGQLGLPGGVKVTASRWELEQKIGRPLTPREEACHSCDNPPCCNQRHLFVGTKSNNMRDMVSKGRGADSTGENNPRAKLTARQVAAIRWAYAGGARCRELAADYGIVPDTVARIVTGKTWAATPGPTRAPRARQRRTAA